MTHEKTGFVTNAATKLLLVIIVIPMSSSFPYHTTDSWEKGKISLAGGSPSLSFVWLGHTLDHHAALHELYLVAHQDSEALPEPQHVSSPRGGSGCLYPTPDRGGPAP